MINIDYNFNPSKGTLDMVVGGPIPDGVVNRIMEAVKSYTSKPMDMNLAQHTIHLIQVAMRNSG